MTMAVDYKVKQQIKETKILSVLKMLSHFHLLNGSEGYAMVLA